MLAKVCNEKIFTLVEFAGISSGAPPMEEGYHT